VPERRFNRETNRWVVTFVLPPEATIGPVWLCGEFNGWSTTALPMARTGDGRHSAEVELEPGRSYRFRYYLGEDRWENDWAADAYVPNEFGGADSVVELPTERPQGQRPGGPTVVPDRAPTDLSHPRAAVEGAAQGAADGSAGREVPAA
jgi:hypothetical protein